MTKAFLLSQTSILFSKASSWLRRRLYFNSNQSLSSKGIMPSSLCFSLWNSCPIACSFLDFWCCVQLKKCDFVLCFSTFLTLKLFHHYRTEWCCCFELWTARTLSSSLTLSQFSSWLIFVLTLNFHFDLTQFSFVSKFEKFLLSSLSFQRNFVSRQFMASRWQVDSG